MRRSVIAYTRRSSGARSTRKGSEAQDEVNLGTVDPKDPVRGRPFDGVEPGHTSRPTVRSKSVHAVEFSKTVAPLRKGFPSEGARSDPLDAEADR